jgi:ubiquinone/menaquinone biosynthesis C-methylase UbiE
MGTEHFDDRAATWDDDPDKVDRARDVAAAVVAAVPTGPDTRVLEYGAGTGLVTQALSDRVGSVTLADNSPGMRAVLQEKIASGALPDGARVWDLDLESQPAPDERFDLVVSSMVMHHVNDLPTVLAGFARLLDAGGHLCLADLDSEDGSFHSYDFGGHHGFDRKEVAAALEATGFTGVTVGDCTEIRRDGSVYSVFLATGAKP